METFSVKTVYLAGPMRGYPKFNFDRFEEASQDLEKAGFTVLAPHRMDLEIGFDPNGDLGQLDMKDTIRRDVEAIMKADAIVLLEGWEKSTGATAEFHMSRWLRKPAYNIEQLCPTNNSQPGLCAIAQ